MITKSVIQTRYILNVPVTALRFNEQIALILKWARNQESRYVCLANVHMIMEAYWNPDFASVLEQADLVTPDGMPLVWMLKKMGVSYQNRVAGMEIFLSLCDLAPQCDLKVFFLGSDQQTLQKVRARVEQEFPDLQIVGMKSLPFDKVENLTSQETIDEINSSGAKLVFVCLGCPKQEAWMALNRDKIQAVMLGFGAVFQIYTGTYSRAPFWLQNLSLEWLYRLKQEPKRLWSRYSRTIPPFVSLAVRQLVKLKIANIILTSNELENLYFEYLSVHKKNKLNYPSLVPQKIGEILIRQKIISSEQLDLLLEKQNETHQKLGELLIQEKLISQMELDYYLLNQKIKLEEILIYNNLITEEKIIRLLRNKISENLKIEELIIQEKLISHDTLNRILIEQYHRNQGNWPIIYL